MLSRTTTGSPAATDVADRRCDRHHERGRRRPDEAALVVRHAVGDAVDLEEVVRRVG